MCEKNETLCFNKKCMVCGKSLAEEDGYYSGEKGEMCETCYSDSAKSLRDSSLNVIKKSILKLLLILAGFTVGLVIGLDIYYGLGIVCDTPIKIIIIPILLPLIASPLAGSPKVAIKAIKTQWQKERNRFGFDDNSAGVIYVAVIVTLFKVLIAMPFFAFYLTFQVVRALIKAIDVYRTASKVLTEISHTHEISTVE